MKQAVPLQIQQEASRADATSDAPVAGEDNDAYASLLRGMATGLFCGLPTSGAGPATLVEALRRCRWWVDSRRFAGAVPHFPDHFGLDEVRASLHRLGFTTSRRRILGAHLSQMAPGSFIHGKEDQFFFVCAADDGQLELFEPNSNTVKPLRARKRYNCLVLSEEESKPEEALARLGWTSAMVQRFTPENNILFFLTFLSNMLVVMASLSVSFIFDKVLPTQAYDTLATLVAGVALLLTLDLTLRRLKARIIARVSGRIDYIVGNSLFEKLMSFRLEMLTASPVADQMNRLKQFEAVRDFYAGPVIAVIFELPFVVIMLGVLFMIDPVVGSILIAAVALYAAIGLVFFPRIRRAAAQIVWLKAECLRLQEETIAQRDQIIQRGLGRVWAARIQPRFRQLARARQRVDGVWRMLNSLMSALTPLIIAGVVFAGALRVISGEMTGGGLVACMILSTRLLAPVQQTLLLAVRAPELSNLMRQIAAMMQLPSPDDARGSRQSAVLHTINAAPPLVFENVVLRYAQTTAPALRGLNITVDAGSFTAVTGPSGSGKSTLLRAAMGHYQLVNGSVLIGHSNVAQLSNDVRSRLMGHLDQHPIQIHGTLAQNLRLSAPEATLSDLHEACEKVGLDTQIAELPEGFDTRVDYQSRYRFTPTFRTKFAFAQILLKRPRVLLLDEPESALSNADETQLMSVIRSCAGDMTVVMITQRPSLMRQADKVLVLQDGQARFYGPPANLNKGQP